MPSDVLISPADDCRPARQRDGSRSAFYLPQASWSTEPFQLGPDAPTVGAHSSPGHTITIRHLVIIFSTVVNRFGTPTGSNRCTDCIQLPFSSLHMNDMLCGVHRSHTLTYTHTHTKWELRLGCSIHTSGGCLNGTTACAPAALPQPHLVSLTGWPKGSDSLLAVIGVAEGDVNIPVAASGTLWVQWRLKHT